MPLYEVKRGDSLWSLAVRNLGGGKRWPEIFNAHNTEAAKPPLQNRLFPITNENLIYIGQMLWIPPRRINAPEGDGTRIQGGKLSSPIDLKVKYTIGRDTPPIEHIWPLVDLTVKTGLSGDIILEITSDDKHRHSIALAMSKNPIQVKQKLYDAYDPAICALTAKPEMIYESGKVKIKAPIGAAANTGPFAINVQTDAPNHMAGSINPPTLSGTIKANNTNFKFSADISLSADVTWHPLPRGQQTEPVRVAEQDKARTEITNQPNSIDWSKAIDHVDELIGMVTLIILTSLPQIRIAGMTTTSLMPFTHTIDRKRHGYPGDA